MGKSFCIAAAVRRLAGVLAVALVAMPVAGQTKLPVYLDISVSDDDPVGRQVVFELKEAIRGSQGFRLVEDKTQWPYLKVIIVTAKTTATGSALSYSFLYDSKAMPLNGALITAVVQTCGPSTVVNCARAALSRIDGASEQLNMERPEFRRTLIK